MGNFDLPESCSFLLSVLLGVGGGNGVGLTGSAPLMTSLLLGGDGVSGGVRAATGAADSVTWSTEDCR